MGTNTQKKLKLGGKSIVKEHKMEAFFVEYGVWAIFFIALVYVLVAPEIGEYDGS